MPDTVTDDNRWSFKEEITTLKDDMKALREDLSSLAAKGKHAVRDEVKDQKDKVTGLIDGARGTVEDYREGLEDRIRAHPLAAVGIAVVAGMVITSMMRRH